MKLFGVFKESIGTYDAIGIAANAAFSKVKEFAFSTVGVMSITTAATYALYKAIQALSDAYNLSYDSAIKNTEESFSNFSSTKTEVEDLKSQVDTAKDSLTSMADTYNIEITGTESITELIDKLKSSDLSLEDRSQVSQIEEENASIERQIALKEKLLKYQQKEAASNAMDTMGRGEQSVAQQVAQKVPGGKKTYQGMVDNVSVVEAAKEDVIAIKDYEDKIAELEKKQAGFDVGSKKWKQAEEDINSYNEAIQTLTSDLDSKQADLTTLLKSFSADGEGTTALSGYEEQFNAIKDALNSINNIDLSPTEKALANLETYFDGSTGKNAIKDQLQDAYDKGKNLETELNRMGLSLDDLGVENVDQLASYFRDTTQAVEEAKKSVRDYSATVSDVESATESVNQDKDWSTMSEAYKNAKELLQQGKTGTDDFQSVASFLNPKKIRDEAKKGGKYVADAYQKAFESAKKTADRWFGENETASMQNFVNDFKNKGLFDVKTDSKGLWDISTNFKTTAEAANEFGISVEAVETMLTGLEAYGYDFGKITFSTEGITEYETALNGIKEIYDSLGEGDTKDRLGELIDGWDSEYEKYQDDLDSLSKDQIVKIKFEYDLASIQQKIDELQRTAEEGGNTQTWAELNATKRQYRDKSEDRKGNKIETVSEYQDVSNTITALQDQMKSASDDEKNQIQEQISNLYDLQNAVNDAFADSGLSWKEFIKTDEYKDAIADMVSSSDDAKQAIADLLGIDVEDIKIDVDADTSKADKKMEGVVSNDGKTIVMNVEATTNQIQTQLDTLQEGQTLLFTAEVDGEPKGIEAIKNVDGTITYTEVVTGNEVEVELNKNGTITYTVVDNTQEGTTSAKKNVESVPDSKQTKFYETGSSNVVSSANKVKNAVNNVPSSKTTTLSVSIGNALQKITQLKNKIRSVTGSVPTRAGGGAAQLSGTAHVYGTLSNKGVSRATGGLYPIPKLSGRALAMGNLEDTSWLKDGWKTKKGEVALTGEVGQELVVDPKFNRWYTVGDHGAEFAHIPQGAVVFNAVQTKELLSKGRINSRGTARLSGTAYRLQGKDNTSSSSSSSSSSGSSGKKKNPKKTKKNSWDSFTDSLSNLFDWAEIKLDRLKSKTEKWADAAERAVDKGNFSSATDKYKKAISSIRKEIEANTTAASKYKSKAKSIGLKAAKADGKGGITASWVNAIMKKIANGTLNINSYGEKKRTVIEEMQKWYDKSLDCSEAVSDLTNQMDDYYESLYNLPIEKATSAIEKLSDSLDRLKDKADLAMKGGITNLYSRLSSEKTTAESEKNTASKQLKSAEKESDSADSAVSKAKKKLPTNLKKKIGKDGYINTKGLKGSSLKKANAYNALVKKQKSASSKKASAKAILNEKNANYNAATSTYNAIIGSQGNLYDNKAPNYKIANSIIDEENENALVQKNALKKAEQEAVKNENDAISKVSSKENSILNKYKKKLSKSQIAAIKAGKKVSTSGIKDKTLLKQLKAYNESVVARQQASKARETAVNNAIQGEIDYATTLQDNEEEKFNNIKTYYGNQIEYQKALNEQQEKSIDLAKAHGDYVKQEDYDVQISNLQKERQLAEAEAKALTSQLNSSVKSGIIAEGSDQWLEMKTQIVEAENSVKDYAEQIENLSQELLELKYEEMFDRAIERAEKYIDKLETINDLITEEMMYDSDTGQLTDMGMLSLALNKGELDRNINSLQSYVKKRQEIIDDYAKKKFGEEKYNELMDDVDSNIQSYISSISSLRDKVLDIIKSQSEAEVNAINKVIDARKELLDKQKDYYDYDKTLKSKTNDIQLLEQQIRALDGVTDAESRAQKARLEAQLKEAKDDLESTVKDHVYELQVSGLDELSDMLNEDYEKYVKELSSNLEKMTNAINTALNSTASNTTNALKLMGELLKPYGITPAQLGITGFASGTKYVSKSGMYLTDENGEEIIVTKQGILRRLNQGDGVVPNDLTERLYEMAETYPMWQNQIPQIVQPEFNIVPNRNVDSINPVIECPITIMGNANEQDVENAVKKTIPMISKTVQNDIRKDLKKAGWK